MPGQVVSFDKMQVGSKGGGKHWTKKEVEQRTTAAAGMTRSRVKLRPPDWLMLDPAAADVWKRTIKRLKGFDVMDDLDSDSLAIYCQAVAGFENLVRNQVPVPPKTGDPDLDWERRMTYESAKARREEEMRKWSRIIVSYAEKLGLTPNGRARLAKKKADKGLKDPNGDLFD
ncbi:MAG: P27 family phage terminase small subunit [Negativicutes bacterium]|nr:P27 family phage terminase small subunit [Negativicutes bacterium]